MRGALVLALLVLTPQAAAIAAPLRLDVGRADGLAVAGNVRFSAPHAMMNLSDEVVAGDVEIRWASAQGYVITMRNERAPGQPASLNDPDPPRNETLRFGAGSLRVTGCAPPCQAVLVASPDADVTVERSVDGPLLRPATPRAYYGTYQQWGPYSFRALVPEGWVDADLRDARLAAKGRLVLFLDGPHGEFRQAGGATPFQSGNSTDPGKSALGFSVTNVYSRRFIVLVLTDAEVVAPRLSTALLSAPSVNLTGTGRFTLENASGAAAYGSIRQRLEEADVEAWGDLAGDVSLAPGEPVWRGALYGSASRFTLDGAQVSPVPPATSNAAALAQWATLLLLLGLAAKGFAWAFYSRLGPDDVLSNKNRTLVFEALAAHPGSRPAELSRATGIHEAVVRYHLKRLVEAGLARSETAGAATLWFARGASATPPIDQVLARRGVRSETVRRLVAALLSFPGGATQLEVSEATGISRRLVSYHLQRLEDVELVTKREGRPARFEPSQALKDAMAGGNPE